MCICIYMHIHNCISPTNHPPELWPFWDSSPAPNLSPAAVVPYDIPIISPYPHDILPRGLPWPPTWGSLLMTFSSCSLIP